MELRIALSYIEKLSFRLLNITKSKPIKAVNRNLKLCPPKFLSKTTK